MDSLAALLPLAGGAVGVPLTFWRLWIYVDKVRTAQLKAETEARKDLELKLDAAEALNDVERIARQAAQEAASLASSKSAGQEETIRYLRAQIDRLQGPGAVT